MVTGYEVTMYRDVSRIATALERIAEALEATRERQVDELLKILRAEVEADVEHADGA